MGERFGEGALIFVAFFSFFSLYPTFCGRVMVGWLSLLLLSFAGLAKEKGRLDRRQGWEREGRTSMGSRWGQPKAGKGMVEVGNKKWAREGGVGVSDMKNAQKIRGVGQEK